MKKYLSSQVVFNRVATHLMTQRKSAMSSTKDCLYRAPGGLKCAIGALIPDKHYSEQIEGGTVDDEKVRDVLEKSDINVFRDEDLLNELQTVHDGSQPSSWKSDLAKVAKKHNLKDTVLADFKAIRATAK